MAAERPLRARLGTVRVRTTLVAVVVTGLALAVGAVVLVAVLRQTLTREVEAAARLRAEDVASVLAADSGGRGPLAVDDAEESLIQVLDEGGRVVAASANAQGLAPVARPRPGESAEGEFPAGGAMRRRASSWPWPPAPTPRWGRARWWWPGRPRPWPRRPRP